MTKTRHPKNVIIFCSLFFSPLLVSRACQGIHRRILQRQADGGAVAGMRICPLHASLPVEFYQVRPQSVRVTAAGYFSLTCGHRFHAFGSSFDFSTTLLNIYPDCSTSFDHMHNAPLAARV